MSELEQREAAAAAAQKPRSPRVTLAEIKTLVASERFFVDDSLTICVLTLTNGYKVTGESASADPANFNPELGKRIAREKALAEVWPLAGYLLREQLHRTGRPPVMRCKVTLASRQRAYQQAYLEDGRTPAGRHEEVPWSHAHGSGVSLVPDPSDPANVKLDGEQLAFYAVCPPGCDPNGSEENRIFGDMTPSFHLTCHVRNQHVLDRLEQGRSYYVDFTPAPTLDELKAGADPDPLGDLTVRGRVSMGDEPKTYSVRIEDLPTERSEKTGILWNNGGLVCVS